MFINTVIKYEDYFRGIYSGLLLVMLSTVLFITKATMIFHLMFICFTLILIVSNYFKLLRESIACYYFRDSVYEILVSFFILLTGFAIIKYGKTISNNYLLNGLCFVFYAVINGFFSLVAHLKEKEFVIHDKFKNKVHVGFKKGVLFFEPVFLERRSDPSHSLAFGVTGSAKTMGVLLPNMVHDIAIGNFVVIIEPKGDKGLRDRIYSLCLKHDRKFKYVSISNADISTKYNPFGFGDANAVKDKIMSSTDWSEEFYKKVADAELIEVLGKIIKGHDSSSKRENFNGIGLDKIINLIPKIKELAGLNAFFKSVMLSSYSKIFATDGETIYDFYKQNCVVYISLDSLSYPLAAQSLGRIVLQDLSTLVGYVYNNIEKSKRTETGIYIDEMATFFSVSFLTFLSQARDAKFTVNMASQSPSDFKSHGDWALARLVDNTPVKYILALQDPDSAEYCAKILGTREFMKYTYQTENDGDETGKGSSRDAHQFNFSPDTVKSLDQFHGVLYDRISKFKELVEFKTIYFDDTVIVEYVGDKNTSLISKQTIGKEDNPISSEAIKENIESIDTLIIIEEEVKKNTIKRKTKVKQVNDEQLLSN